METEATGAGALTTAWPWYAPQRLLRAIGRLVRWCTDRPGDTEEERLLKTTFVGMVLLIVLLTPVWTTMYFYYGAMLAAAIPLAYSVLSLLDLAVLGLTKAFHVFRTIQLALILLLPFLLMLALGGFVSGSAVVFWSLVAPLSAVLFASRKQALLWFAAFVCLLVIGAVLETRMPATNAVPVPVITRNAFFALNIAGPSLVAVAMVLYFFTQRKMAMEALREEQNKSERLLLNVLPEEIAEKLKRGQTTVAEHFDAVSVLFADIVGSTDLAMRLTPQALVDLLNELFSHFDTLVQKYGLEKVRTMGDSYMVASGIPRPRPDHAQALARMALEMRDYLRERPASDGLGLEFRIGMNSGPAVAGIIGHTKFHYDIWGDAVNIASRMESQGVPGRIQISRETYELLKDEFVCEPRGAIDVKGKGQMEVWFLEGTRPQDGVSTQGHGQEQEARSQ